MATCEETLAQLYAYLDEVLDEEMRSDIATHIGGCTECSSHVDFELSLMVHIRRKSQEEPLPDELRRKILECFDIDVSDAARREEP